MSFFDRLLGRSDKGSGAVAKERLQLVLIQDRVRIPPVTMDKIRDEIIEVISKYVDIDETAMDITLTKSSRENRLVADIPVLGTKNHMH